MTRNVPTLADIGEEALIARIAQILGKPPANTLGIGDDAALILPGRGHLLLTTDALVEGTHFLRTWFRPEEAGGKVLASNISDAAAMGGKPSHTVVSLVLPARTPVESVERLYRGMKKMARAEGVSVIGGNVARGKAVSITVALVGTLPQGEPVLRSGARPGDRLFVTGQPGLAYLGQKLLASAGRRRELPDLWNPPAAEEPRWRKQLGRRSIWARRALRRFLLPQARVQAARDLNHYRPTSMIDVSDGLSRDLGHLARAGTRLWIRAEQLPHKPGFAQLARKLGETAESAILRGGEDYELLVTLPPASAQQLGGRAVVGGVPLTEIGEVLPGSPGVFLGSPGELTPLPESGFQHFD